jgi:hypothetical protein
MVGHLRHAAGRPLYEVHEILEGDPALDLGVRFETVDFGAAVDFAFDFLEREDPRREGAVSALEIVRVEGSRREAVWSYNHSRSHEPAARNPVGVWGFDVTRRWQGPYRTPVRPKAAYR